MLFLSVMYDLAVGLSFLCLCAYIQYYRLSETRVTLVKLIALIVIKNGMLLKDVTRLGIVLCRGGNYGVKECVKCLQILHVLELHDVLARDK